MKTPPPSPQSSNCEQPVEAVSGWFILLLMVAFVVLGFILASTNPRNFSTDLAAGTLGTAVAVIFLGCGLFALQPNEAAVLTLFGAYAGTVRASGFFWVNPFKKRLRVSLRARNFNGEKLKVNDKRGNPIEIAVVVVWRIQDTAQAVFDVENYDNYVHVQSESALRHVANSYAYDDGERHEISLRGGGEQITAALMDELRERLDKAGVAVEEARLTHLAYAPEIAQAMLRRQQAEAIIAARQKIVLGAVSMVDMALRELAQKQVIVLDDERKASMVSNLLVILCGETAATPVINAGTLYS